MAEQRDPKQLLEEAIRKRDELNTFIRVYQEMLGIGESPAGDAAGGGLAKPAGPTLADGADALSVVYPGMFFGRSQPQAVKLFLEAVRPRPQKTKAIIEALQKGGCPIGGKKPAVNLWGVLDRNKDTFILVPKAGWGLVDWYDPAAIAKMRKEGVKEGSDAEEAKNGAKSKE